MIGFVGDIHGSLMVLSDYAKEMEGKISCLIQVGDFGVHPTEIVNWKARSWGLKIPTYFIDGNHDYFEYFFHHDKVTEILPNLFYVPRGTVMELDGKVIAFLGGASSIDKLNRIKQKMHWDPREDIRGEDVDRLYENVKKINKPIDILVTHIPPYSIIKANFNDSYKTSMGVSENWEDPNGIIVQEVWNKLGRPMMYCGHMHKSVCFDSNSRILDINELYVYPSMYSSEELKKVQDKCSPKGIIIAH